MGDGVFDAVGVGELVILGVTVGVGLCVGVEVLVEVGVRVGDGVGARVEILKPKLFVSLQDGSPPWATGTQFPSNAYDVQYATAIE